MVLIKTKKVYGSFLSLFIAMVLLIPVFGGWFSIFIAPIHNKLFYFLKDEIGALLALTLYFLFCLFVFFASFWSYDEKGLQVWSFFVKGTKQYKWDDVESLEERRAV